MAAIQLFAILVLARHSTLQRRPVLLVMCMLALAVSVMILSRLPAQQVRLAIAGCCHALVYVSLLTWFTRSLRPGRLPVVTGFARQLRQTMPDKVLRYTRQVTVAWCAFFAAQLALSALLLLCAPQAAWSFFVNLLNLPLLAAMLLAELGVRHVLFRNEPHTGLLDTISAMRRARFTPSSGP